MWGGGQFLCCPPTLKSGGKRPPVPHRSTLVASFDTLLSHLLVSWFCPISMPLSCLFPLRGVVLFLLKSASASGTPVDLCGVSRQLFLQVLRSELLAFSRVHVKLSACGHASVVFLCWKPAYSTTHLNYSKL